MSGGPTVQGVDPVSLQRWFEERLDITGDLTFEHIEGGRSNLTFAVSDEAGGRWVLRRPPLGQVLATAHDMAREHRIISALAGTGVPVPGIIGLCEDEVVNGAPFYAMEFVEGMVVRTYEDASALEPALLGRMGASLVEVLARLHDLDVDAVGLGDFARRDGYIQRQLKRWRLQFEQSSTRDIPRVLEVHDRLAARVPEQQGVGIVHGDYRLDNCMMRPDGGVAAVLDWELCTLGDVLADLAAMIAYADQRAAGDVLLNASAQGYPSPDEVRDLYASHSGRDLEHLDFYLAFAHWRTACIVEGVFSRYEAGVMGEADPDLTRLFGDRVLALAEIAAECAGRLR
ncbi:MAG: phosphotransferase family protein [Actinobacteria bacterium]|nr:phosphotransferase family protein [Actinomycetota bacterium]